jgi:hypothetical protein
LGLRAFGAGARVVTSRCSRAARFERQTAKRL